LLSSLIDIDTKSVAKIADWNNTSEQNYTQVLNKAQQIADSMTAPSVQNTSSSSNNDFSQPYNNFLNNFYQQQEITSLNNIGSQLHNIWNQLSY
jgi:hypothetical protein